MRSGAAGKARCGYVSGAHRWHPSTPRLRMLGEAGVATVTTDHQIMVAATTLATAAVAVGGLATIPIAPLPPQARPPSVDAPRRAAHLSSQRLSPTYSGVSTWGEEVGRMLSATAVASKLST